MVRLSTPRLRRLLDRVDGGTGPLVDRAPHLRYSIDEPAPGSTVQGKIWVRGWAAWDDRPVLAVAVHLEGRLVGWASTGIDDRPDVAEALGCDPLRRAGWSVDADLGSQPIAQPSLLVVTVWPDVASGPVALDPVPVVFGPAVEVPPDGVAGEEIHAHFDRPGGDELIGLEAVRLEGWIYHDRHLVASVDVIANGRHAGRARLGLARPDLGGPGRLAHVPLSGFEHVLDLALFPVDERVVRVQLVARVSGGHPVVAASRVFRRATGGEDARELTPVGPGTSGHRVRRPGPGTSDPFDLVVFTHDLGYGGGQLWLSELLAQAGAGRAFPCTVVSPSDGPLRGEFEAAGMTVRITQPYPVDSLASYEGRVDEISLLVASGGHTVALVNTLLVALGADVTRRLGIPTVWAIHESMSATTYWSHALGSLAIPSGIRRRFEETLRDTSALVFEAEATCVLYASLAGPGRSVVIPYGIDTAAVQAFADSNPRDRARGRLGISSDRKVALVMGTTEPRKAQTRLAQAFARVAADHPDWDLVFVGDTGTPYADALKSFVSESGLGERVRTVPVVPDIYPWYRAADLLVSASDIESLPRSVLEAMCFGIPVAATSIFGLPELISDGETGFLFEPGDLDALTGAFRRAFSTPPEQMATIGAAARRLILDAYDSAGYATDIISLLERMRRDPGMLPSEHLSYRRRPVTSR